MGTSGAKEMDVVSPWWPLPRRMADKLDIIERAQHILDIGNRHLLWIECVEYVLWRRECWLFYWISFFYRFLFSANAVLTAFLHWFCPFLFSILADRSLTSFLGI